MAKMGRPEKPIDWKVFEELCHIQCTHEEIANVCKISRSALYERALKEYGEDFPTVYKKFTDVGKMSLRRTQFKLSQKNTAMAIWLGKQYLDQKDHQEVKESPNQSQIDNSHTLLKEIHYLRQKLNELQPKANPELL